MNRLQIESYLRFGYDITFDDWRYEFDFSRINKLPYANKNLPELIQIGAQILMNSLQQLYENNEVVVVPTSGGVDSRVLLGFMLKHKESKDIKTYTFGVPNTYDFDIGNQITKYCNTNHMVFDLNKHNYSLDELIETSRCMSHQSPLFFHPPLFKLRELYADSTIWTGVNAGAVVGSFAKHSYTNNIDEAIDKFLKKDIFKKKIKLHTFDNTKFKTHVNRSTIDPQLLSLDEQITIKERSLKYLAPHVLLKGFNYKLPFINTPFMDFMFSVPNEYRIGKMLYRKIAEHLFPDLFQFPLECDYGLKSFYGKKIIRYKQLYVKMRQRMYEKQPRYCYYLSPMINYFNLDEAFRSNSNLKKIIFEQLQDLKDRKIVDAKLIDQIWDNHQNYHQNLSTEINFLFSLEIHHKAGKV